MLNPIDEERCKLTAQCRRRVVDREDRIGHSGMPYLERRAISRMMASASAAESVERVGTAWTLPYKKSTWTCTWSNPAAVLGRPMSQSTPMTPPRRDGSGSGCRGPTCSALVRWQMSQERTYAITSVVWPGQNANRRTVNQRHRLVPSKVTAQGGVVALLNDALAKAAALRNAEAIRLALSSSVE